MRVKQAVKHFTLLSMIAVGVSACSSTQDIEEKPTQAPVVLEPVIEEIEEEVVSKVINNGVIDIPILDNAQVFAEFTDKLPAVINYFTRSSEAEVIDFYQQAFGEPYSQDLKRGRLTLQYQEGEEVMRVVISQQNKKRQVDVIIENKN
jgi:ABC-type taurine transport system substrate-binding protein